MWVTTDFWSELIIKDSLDLQYYYVASRISPELVLATQFDIIQWQWLYLQPGIVNNFVVVLFHCRDDFIVLQNWSWVTVELWGKKIITWGMYYSYLEAVIDRVPWVQPFCISALFILKVAELRPEFYTFPHRSLII